MKDSFVVDVPHMLLSLGIRNIKVSGDECTFSCPFPAHPRGDLHPSGSMNLITTLYRCFSCHATGNAVTFLSRLEGVPTWTARRWLEEKYGDGFHEPDGSLAQELEAIMRGATTPLRHYLTLPESALEPFCVDWKAVEASSTPPEGLLYARQRMSLEALLAWEIGFDVRSFRFTIPVRDRWGKLVGFKARAVLGSQEPKYMNLGKDPYDFEPYAVGLHLFGAHKVSEPDTIIVVESELDVISLWESSISKAVALGSSKISNEQISILRDIATDVVLCLDWDDAGKAGTFGYFDDKDRWCPGVAEQLSSYMAVKIVGEHEKDPNDLGIEQRQELISNSRPMFSFLV